MGEVVTFYSALILALMQIIPMSSTSSSSGVMRWGEDRIYV
jgi:hypothetical protein